MTNNHKQVEYFVAKAQIRDAIERLARGEDRRDAILIGSAYWPDSVTDYGVFSGSFAEYLDWVVPGSPALPVTQHLLGQSYTVVTDDLQSARVETQVFSYHRVDHGEQHKDTCIGGRYLDQFECREGDWRILSRLMVYDWYQDLGEAIDWAQGLMGQTLSSPQFIGSAADDVSRRFFQETD